MKYAKLAATLAVAGLVAACGGGGGGDGGASAGGTTGFWEGTTSSGQNVAAAIFPGGETWAVYATTTTLGVVQGTINGAARDFSFTSGTITDVTLNATAVPRTSISGSITAGGTAVTFTGTYGTSFDQAPNLAQAAGVFNGIGPSAGTTITLAASGAITGATGGCGFTGNATPRTDGNAFNVTMTFGGAPCVLAGQTVTGIAFYDNTDGSLSAAAINGPRTGAAIFVGEK